MSGVEQHALICILPEQVSNAGAGTCWQQVSSYVLGADCVGLGFFIILALVVAANGHRKAEADQESQQCQHRSQHNTEIVSLNILQRKEIFSNLVSDMSG